MYIITHFSDQAQNLKVIELYNILRYLLNVMILDVYGITLHLSTIPMMMKVVMMKKKKKKKK